MSVAGIEVTPLSEQECREIIAPHMGRLAAAVERGVRQWTDMQRDPSVSSRFKASMLQVGNGSRASLINGWIRSEVESEFAEVPHVLVRSKGQVFYLIVDGRVAIEFKKFTGPSLRVSRNRTSRQTKITNQTQLVADADVTPTWLTVGYLPDATHLGIQRIAAACRLGLELKYSFDLETNADLLPFAVLPIEASADDDQGLIIRPAAGQPGAATGTHE
ncbi:MAG: hypothetical protein HHJ11_04355 [Phycicoccus sp.]|nr:hypothetical protein [Phycicoccus sp.]NMM35166.1 hypothetical protein [Phycicoccus sp.]